MKLCRFSVSSDASRVGVIRADTVLDITPLFEALGSPPWPYPPHDWIIGNWDLVKAKIDPFLAEAKTFALSDVRLLAPVANPGKIIGAPINYKDHIAEANADQEISKGKVYTTIDTYGLFIKAPTSLIGPADTVMIPFAERRTDHEVELGLVIGKKGKNISRENALEHVFGYCVALDMTVRGAEFPGYRKSFDTFAVMGPWLTTADEVPDPNVLGLELTVNGALKQKSNTSYLINNVQWLIEYASRTYTLHPGDVIMTGTPAGVGPVVAGDLINARVDGLGELAIKVALAQPPAR